MSLPRTNLHPHYLHPALQNESPQACAEAFGSRRLSNGGLRDLTGSHLSGDISRYFTPSQAALRSIRRLHGWIEVRPRNRPERED